jgi:hypothetical protein
MSSARPSNGAGRRRAGSQAYLLAKYEELGKLNEAYWELVDMHACEPDRYRQVTGSDHLPQYETFHRYWTGIPVTQRRAAKRRYLSRI